MNVWETDNAIEPELRGPTPRRVRYTPFAQGVRVFLRALLVGGLGTLLWLANRDLSDLAALQAQGVMTMATVTGTHTSSGKSTTYYVDYMFTANGVTVVDDDSVSYAFYSHAGQGDSLLVTYLPSSPHTHRVGVVDQARISDQRRMWALVTLGAALFLGVLLLIVELNYRSQRGLLTDGVPVTGEITNRIVERGKNTYYYVYYEFSGPAGTLRDRASTSQSLYNGCEPGKTLTILYNPTRPSENRPYLAMDSVTLSTLRQ